MDLEAHVRFLVAMPLLIVAGQPWCTGACAPGAAIPGTNLIPESAMTRFEAAIASAFRLRDSLLAEVLLIAFVYGVGILIVSHQYMALDAATWYATPSADGSKPLARRNVVRLRELADVSVPAFAAG